MESGWSDRIRRRKPESTRFLIPFGQLGSRWQLATAKRTLFWNKDGVGNQQRRRRTQRRYLHEKSIVQKWHDIFGKGCAWASLCTNSSSLAAYYLPIFVDIEFGKTMWLGSHLQSACRHEIVRYWIKLDKESIILSVATCHVTNNRRGERLNIILVSWFSYTLLWGSYLHNITKRFIKY